MVVKESIFWNLIRIIWQKKKILIISFFASMIITLIVTTLMSKTYKARLTFIVNEENTGFNISSLISDIPFDIAGLEASKSDKYVALLKSRNVRDVLIEKFNLWEEYDEEYLEFLYKELDKNIEVEDNLDNTVTINCYFKDSPEKALDMLNSLYNELYNYSLELNKAKSKDYREYMEKSLNETFEKVALLEDSLKHFQMKNKIILFDEQAKFSFQALGELEAQNMEYKVEYAFLQSSVSNNNPELQEIKRKLDAVQNLKNNLYKEGEEYIIAFNKMPEYGIKYYRLLRDIGIQQQILKILLPIVQNARIEEQKETVNIQIIDEPFLPQYKVKPKRILYMIVVTMLVLIIELFYFAFMDIFSKNKNQIIDWVSKE